MDTQKARCAECRTDISIPSTYAHGDHVKCATCQTRHKVVRSGEAVRLVLADVGPLKDALRANEMQQSRLEAELRHARASLGIGVPNGIGISVAYAIWQVGFKDRQIGMPLLVLWGTRGQPPTDLFPTVWRKFASNLVDAQPLPTGHYLQEEAPDQVYDHFVKFFTA